MIRSFNFEIYTKSCKFALNSQLMHVKSFFNFRYLLALFMLYSCSEKLENIEVETKNQRIISTNESLINPLYVGLILESPQIVGSVWNSDVLAKNQVSTINLFLKGISSHRDLLEKHAYRFYKHGNPRDYSRYIYKTSKSPITNLDFLYDSVFLKQISIHNFLNSGSQPPVFFSKNDSFQLQVNVKGENLTDSIFYFPMRDNPKMTVFKNGNFLDIVEVKLENEYSSDKFKLVLTELDSTLSIFELAEKRVVITKNGLPVESYIISDSYEKDRLIKEWFYNDANMLVEYQEYVMGKATKNITFVYRNNNFPDYLIQNRKKFYFHYDFFDVN
jgi:hypothetical protein